MDHSRLTPASVLHWNYRGFTEFPLQRLSGEESEITDIYLKENLITRVPSEICRLENLESLYLSGNDLVELPAEISKLSCLKCLDVSGNRLRSLPAEIGEVSALKFLILDENELTEIPLRIAELRSLRYLSVCDNKLQWLPQRPVYNYFHCEFRFWRNASLKSIPYSLWYHMFREQQTRSLNIGCLIIPKHDHLTRNNRCRLKINKHSRTWEYDLDCPPYHITVFDSSSTSPPSLYELSKRTFYQTISDTAKELAEQNSCIFWDSTNYYCSRNSDNMTNLDIVVSYEKDSNNDTDVNGNELGDESRTNDNMSHQDNGNKTIKTVNCVPADVIETHYSFLPKFMKHELCNGPISRCENTSCKKPLFDYVHYEFSVGTITLIDNSEDIILSAALCSKKCSETWKRGKRNLLTWKLLQ